MNNAEIEAEIRRLEASDTTMQNCSRLAVLYVINDHKKTQPRTISTKGNSQFLDACKNAPIEKVLDVLDEHMSCIEILYPREYQALIKKIKEAKI